MRILFLKSIFFHLLIVGCISCKKSKAPDSSEGEPGQAVLLKDINIANLPSPYYKFEYDSKGRPVTAVVASGLRMYDIVYSGRNISEMKNDVEVNKDKLQYLYDNEGRVNAIQFVDSAGVLYKRVSLKYNDRKLVELVRYRKTAGGFDIERSMTFSYYGDGNLWFLIEKRYQPGGAVTATYIDSFEGYDDKVNVDGFSLIHSELFEHLLLLPGIRLQKNNPGKLTRVGDGVNYRITYSYTFNGKNLPLTKRGEAVITNGPSMGQVFETNSLFSYY